MAKFNWKKWLREMFRVDAGDILKRKHELILAPHERYQKYKEFPRLRCFVHLSIVLVITIQALLIGEEQVPYSNANESTFVENFFPKGFEDGIFTITDTLAVINSTITKYYSFPYTSVDKYSFLRDIDGNIQPILFTITRYSNLTGDFWKGNFFDVGEIDDEDLSGDFSTIEEEYYLSPLPIDQQPPFNYVQSSPDMHELFYSINSMQMEFTYKGVNIGNLAVTPHYWDISLYFSSVNGGQLKVSLWISERVIDTPGISRADIMTSISVVLLFLSSVSAVISSTRIIQYLAYFLVTRRTYMELWSAVRFSGNAPNKGESGYELSPSWKDISFGCKCYFFEFWTLLSLTGSITVMVACVMGVFVQFGVVPSTIYMAVFGLGCMMMGVNILRYLEYNRRLFLYIQTLYHSIGHILRFVVSVIPIYWAFVVTGVLNFGPYVQSFRNIEAATMTLFGLVNADGIVETFEEIENAFYPMDSLARLYIFAFVTLFVTTIVNIFIFIIEDAYRLSNREEHFMSPNKAALQMLFNNIEFWAEQLKGSPDFFNSSVYDLVNRLLDAPEVDTVGVELGTISSSSGSQEEDNGDIEPLRSSSSTSLLSSFPSESQKDQAAPPKPTNVRGSQSIPKKPVVNTEELDSIEIQVNELPISNLEPFGSSSSGKRPGSPQVSRRKSMSGGVGFAPQRRLSVSGEGTGGELRLSQSLDMSSDALNMEIAEILSKPSLYTREVHGEYGEAIREEILDLIRDHQAHYQSLLQQKSKEIQQIKQQYRVIVSKLIGLLTDTQ